MRHKARLVVAFALATMAAIADCLTSPLKEQIISARDRSDSTAKQFSPLTITGAGHIKINSNGST